MGAELCSGMLPTWILIHLSALLFKLVLPSDLELPAPWPKSHVLSTSWPFAHTESSSLQINHTATIPANTLAGW